MVVSVAKGHGAAYLLDGVARGRENYYLGAVTAGEPVGQWNGRGAAALGLTGDVADDVMEAVFGRFLDPSDPLFADPATREQSARLGSAPRQFRDPKAVLEEKLRKNPHALPEEIAHWQQLAEREQRGAIYFADITFGVPKSVTVLHTAFRRAALEAERGGDTAAAAAWMEKVRAVDSAVLAGNAAMLEFMNDRAMYARAGSSRSGRSTHYLAQEGIFASFRQHDNRDLEPHLHVHNATLNRARAEDGKIYAVDVQSLKYWAQAAGAIAERTMQEDLTRSLGLRWKYNPRNQTREVDGVDSKIVALFSERTAKVTRKAAEFIAAAEEKFGRTLSPLERSRLRQVATFATRARKSHTGETVEQQLDRWDRTLRREIAGGLARVAKRFENAAPRPAAGQQDRAARFAAAADLPHYYRRDVITRALAATQKGRSTWTRSELMRRVDQMLPDNLGGLRKEEVRALIETLTEEALASEDVIQTSGRPVAIDVPPELRRADGASVYEAPNAAHYATRDHVIAEEALRRAAVERGGYALPRREVDAWIKAREGMLLDDQKAAVRGIATSDARLSVLVGPAGTGKSFASGALAAVWADVGGGKLIGLAVSEVATNELRNAAVEELKDAGIEYALNTAQWLKIQERIAAGQAAMHRNDHAWVLTRRDVVLVDEASMVDTEQLALIREIAARAGSRVVLIGDPAQLGSVNAGGVMGLLANGVAETYTLQDVRRFDAGWERAASLKLREGDASAVREYDRHGRIIDAGDRDQARDRAAKAYVADRLAGKRSVVVTDTNAEAASLSVAIRDHLIGLGLVEEDGVNLARENTTAGVGDIVAARRNDWNVMVLNRRQYEVTAVHEDGGVTVANVATGQVHRLSAEYVNAHLSLGYAGTIHSTQGATVDTSAVIVSSKSSRAGTYVGMTRGRERNTAYVVTHDSPHEFDKAQGTKRASDVGQLDQPRTATAVFGDVIERDSDDAAAIKMADAEEEAHAHASTPADRMEDAIRKAGMHRAERWFDDLAHEGVLSEADRARIGADQGTEFLRRVLRSAELAGHDPRAVLRDAITDYPLSGVRSVAQVLSARIRDAVDLTPREGTRDQDIPDLSAEWNRYLAGLRQMERTRQTDLGDAAAAAPPAWAVAALGPVPDTDDGAARAEWRDKAGVVAFYREATGWDNDDVAIGPAPGLGASERRARWHEAWHALGRPEDAQAAEGDMSEGALRNRVWAWRHELAWAPPFVDAGMRAAHTTAFEAGQEATLAAALGDDTDAEVASFIAEEAGKVTGALDDAARERARWLVQGAGTREAAIRAEHELSTRGIVLEDPAEKVYVQDRLWEIQGDGDAAEIVQVETPQAPARVADLPDRVPTVHEVEQAAKAAAFARAVIDDRDSHDASASDGEGWHDAVAAVDEQWHDASDIGDHHGHAWDPTLDHDDDNADAPADDAMEDAR